MIIIVLTTIYEFTSYSELFRPCNSLKNGGNKMK